MTVEEQVRKLNDWYSEHKDEIEEPLQGSPYNRILKLLYYIYYTDLHKDIKQSLLGTAICEMIDFGDTIKYLEDQVSYWQGEAQDWCDTYYEQLNDEC